MPSPSLNPIAHNSTTLTATAKWAGTRVAYEVMAGEVPVASMWGNIWRSKGEIETFGQSEGDPIQESRTYQVDPGGMVLNGETIALYHFSYPFLRLASITIRAMEGSREFDLRQRRIWSGHLVLSEDGVPVGTYTPRSWRSAYTVTAQPHVPQDIVLLSIWLVLVRGLFNA